MTAETERLLIDLLAECRSVATGFPMRPVVAGELAARIMEELIENSAQEIADEEFDRRITAIANKVYSYSLPEATK